jgi:purine-nucleoside phosphorylase
MSTLPDIAVVLGTGLGIVTETIEKEIEISTSDIPGYPSPSIPGHEGKIISARIGGKNVMIFKGRVHMYEGASVHEAALPAYIAAEFQVKTLIVTNAAGGLNIQFAVGDLMLITDYIITPLAYNMGLSFRKLYNGETMRQPVVSCKTLQRVRSCAADRHLALQEGVYAMVSGPSYETRAEIHFLRSLGADVVGMSSAPEIMVARRAGIEVIGISCITNMAKTVATPVSHAEVTRVAESATEKLSALILAIIQHS